MPNLKDGSRREYKEMSSFYFLSSSLAYDSMSNSLSSIAFPLFPFLIKEVGKFGVDMVACVVAGIVFNVVVREVSVSECIIVLEVAK